MALQRIVLLFIIYLYSCEALDYKSKVIQFVRVNKRDSEKEIHITALPAKPFNFVFDEVNAKEISCKYLQNDVYHQCNACQFTLHNHTTSVVEIDKVTKDMSTQWNCTITLKVNDDGVPINNGEKSWYKFNMRVKRAKTVKLKIVGNNVLFENTDLSVNYDGVYEYICEDGFTVDLSFENVYNGGSIIMRYYNAQDILILESDIVGYPASLTFRQLMTSTIYNGSYVECTYSSNSAIIQDFKYRTIFIVRDRSDIKDDFIVSINNVRLIPTQLATNAYEANKYDYKYIYGEQLNASCENTKTPSDRMYGQFTTIQKEDVDNTMPLPQGDTAAQILSSFYCTSSKDDLVKANVKFSVGRSDNPLVHGLRARDVLLQYSQNCYKTITRYQYTENEAFNLRCHSDQGLTKWISGDNEIPGYESGHFTLKAEHNNTHITCEAQPNHAPIRTILIVFLMKPSVPIDDSGSSLDVIIGCVFGVLAVIVCAIFVYCRYTKKRAVGLLVEGPNLNPNQPEIYDYTYVEAGDMIENAYYCGTANYKVAQDAVNTTKTPADPHYAEIGDPYKNKNENKPLTYAVPYAHLKKDNNVTLNNVNYENLNNENSKQTYSNLQNEINNMQYSNLKMKNTNNKNF